MNSLRRINQDTRSGTKRGKTMNAAKVTLTSTVLAAALGLVLGLMSTPAQAHCAGRHINNPSHCDGDGDGSANATTFKVDVKFHTMFADSNTIGSDIDVPFMDGVDGVQGEIIDGFRMWTGDNSNRQLWIDLGEIGVDIDDADCPFIDAHREVAGRCDAFGEGTPRAHTVYNDVDVNRNRLLTMAVGDTGTVTPDRDGVIFGWRVDLTFYAKLKPKGKKSSFWSILFNADPNFSDVHSDFGADVDKCTSEANTSLNIERTGDNTWDIFTNGMQPACLFKHTDGVTAMGIVDVDLSYTITCVDDCPVVP